MTGPQPQGGPPPYPGNNIIMRLLHAYAPAGVLEETREWVY
jgi:hypothetical protein